ncbi:hypothetical protein [Kribbella lupini]|uniref:hypothetical protein n=1 Tax=Kribbella lupini TaxID=291602 RepID=UPI0031D390E2
MTASGFARRLAQLAGWSVVPLVVIVLLDDLGHPADATARYLAAWCVLVLLPGTLLWRTLTGGRSWAQDLGFGSVLGLAWALGVWAVFTGLGYPRQQWMATVGLVIALLPLLRRRSPEPITWLPVMVLGLVLAAVRVFVELLRLTPLPPAPFGRHQDLWFQLGLVHALERHVVPPDLSAAGEPLIYHWFTNALMAAHGQVSGVGAPEVLLHQWPMTMALTFVLAGWAAGELLSGTRWAGPVAGLVSGVFAGGLRLTDEPGVDMAGALSIQGPTGTLAAVVMLGLVGPTVLILRRQAGKGTWIALVMLLALACGTKPTLLPIMAVGCAVAGVACWLVDRRFPLRVVVLGLLCAGLFLAGASTLTGSTGGSRIQFLAALRVLPYYGVVTGDRSFPTYGGVVVPGIADGGLWPFAAVLVAWYCVLSLPRLLAVVGVMLHPTRRDPAYWWAAACVVTGAAITLVFSHTGYSEYHFLRTVIHLGPVVVVAFVARVLGEEVRHRKVWMPLAISLAGGIGTAVVLKQVWPAVVVSNQKEAALDLLGPAGVLVVAAGVSMLVIRRVVAPRHWPRALVVYATCFIAASSLPAQSTYLAVASYGAVVDRPFGTGQGTRIYLTRAEQEAMLWLHEHAGPDDVAVSNVFCMPTRYRPGCPNDAYWVSGLSGVQQYLGGWAYAPENLAATHHTRSYLSLPPPWPDRLQESLDAVRRPTAELLSQLHNEKGVDWIVADLRAGPVSPALERLAVPAYANSDVRIYRLR